MATKHHLNKSLIMATALTLLGGCAEFSQTWNEIAEAFKPESDQHQATDTSKNTTSRVTKPVEIAALDSFEPAAEQNNALPSASLHMKKLAKEVLAVMSNHSLSKEKQHKFFRRILKRDLDIPLIARFAIGRTWSRITSDQQQSYLNIFTQYVLATYTNRLGGAYVDRFEVVEAKPLHRKDILVRSRIAKKDAKPVRADWRLRKLDGRYLILDLSVEGISMALTLRQEFASVIRRQGGIDGLISLLKKRIST